MIISEINIFNLGVYKGQHSINIKPKPGKPVILFGALNGAGKTTLLEGIQIALYGKAAKTNGRGSKSYEEYLSGLINRDTPQKYGASIEIIFTVNVQSKPSEIKITRSWKETGKGIKENCSIVQDGVLDSDNSDRASEFIEEIIPSEISNLFFFDGEMIDGYSQPEQSKSLIQKGIYTLLGINTINNLTKSLMTIEKRKAKVLADEIETVSIESEEKDLGDREKRIQGLLQDKASLRNELDVFYQEHSKNQDTLKQQGYGLYKKRELLRQEYKSLISQKEMLSLQMIEISQDTFPLIVIEDQVSTLRQIITKSEGHSTKSIALLEAEFHNILNIKNLNELDKETLKAYGNNRIEKIKESIGSYSYDLDVSLIPTATEQQEEKKKINKLVSDYEKIELDSEVIEKKIGAIPDEDKIRPLIETELALQKNIDRAEGKMQLIDNEIHLLTKQITEIQRQLNIKIEKINAQSIRSIVDKKVVEKSQKTRQTLEVFKDALINKHIDNISSQISSSFKSLSRKKTLDLVFKINPGDFSLEVFKNTNGTIEPYISPKSWAAGEKQILGISILWALTKVANMNFPIVIDTPFSRLDSSHRDTVIRNYFPNASNQVLVFSTDTEIDEELLETIKPNVSFEYLIQYDGKTNSSSFHKGYFTNDKVIA